MAKGSTKLTEDLLRSLSTEQSFERGRQYYRAGAIYNATRQGNLLTALCEGSSAPAYRLRVELDQAGVRSASCTCPYDWGGLCKHLVALLLVYIHQPETFTERGSVADMLAGLERDDLVALVENLAVIQAQQGKIQQGMARLIDSYAEGFVQKAEFEPRITCLRQRLLELEQQAQLIQDQETIQAELQTAISRLEEFGEKVKDNLAEADWQKQRELIRMLVKRVEIGKEEVKIVFRIPPDLAISGSDGNSLQHCWKREQCPFRQVKPC